MTTEQVTETIAQYNKTLASLYASQPFRRVDLAYAFARGFKANEYGDVPKVAYEVIAAAEADKRARRADYAKAERF